MSATRLHKGAADVAPAALLLALLVWAAIDQGGYAITRWAPVGVVTLLLLGVRLFLAPPAWAAVPRAALVATGALGLYAAWSALSITWAQDKGIAWDGADRTLLYLGLFALPALWPIERRRAGAIAAAWALAIATFAVVTLLHDASVAHPLSLFIDDRVLGPAGYVNATSALWLMAMWVAVLVGASPETPWPARGVLAAAATLLCSVALLSQSRGSVIATPLTAVLLLVAFPGRVRLFALLVPIAAGVAAAAGPVLDVGAAVRAGRVPSAEIDSAATAIMVAAGVVGAVVAGAGMLVARRPPGAETVRRVHRAGVVAIVTTALVAVAAGLAITGSPASATSRAWHSFKGGYADSSANRLTTGLGSNRYDFYRVGLNAFRAHPVGGLGADNFRSVYLRERRSPEAPTYPHSVEVRTLVSTGAVGAALLLAFLVASAIAVVAGARRAGSALGVAGAGAFVYWAVHGSADWLWEIAGLGGAAFALAGVAVASAARPVSGPSTRRGRLAAAVLGVLALAALAALGPPWLAQRQLDRAGSVFATDPGGAIALARSAAAIDRLDATPRAVEGAAWLRVGDLGRARAAFDGALARDRDNFYATLQLGAIASAAGQPDRARTLLLRARALAPSDPVAAQTLAVVEAGRRVSLPALQQALGARARRFGAR